MRRLLLVFGMLCASSAAFACDTYKSGARTITYDGNWDAGFILIDQGQSRHFAFADAGAGTKTIIGIPDDGAEDAAQIKTPPGSFWFGPEHFVESCK